MEAIVTRIGAAVGQRRVCFVIDGLHGLWIGRK